ncbi:MAG TPA: hypothetical protein VKQ08_00390 [Cyclobacteriaceae bacterium]|nr:hypothetical protein [Cyclobacteriaceae bacterium]
METSLKKLVPGSGSSTTPVHAIAGRAKNIRAIWNNQRDSDMGVEKMVRLFLASPFFFPGMYIKELAGRKGQAYQDLAVDILVLCKGAFSVVILANGWQNNPLLFWLLIWFMVETVSFKMEGKGHFDHHYPS